MALVTGGLRGIGRAIVRRLARDGAAVVFGYRTNQAAAGMVVDEVTEAGGCAVAVRADQGDPAGVASLFETAERRFRRLDALVLNAAAYPQAAITETTDRVFDQVMAVNLEGPFQAIRRAGRTLRDNGRIIAISSINTALPEPGTALYAASKAALERLSAAAAHEFGHRGITVNSVCPGRPIPTCCATGCRPRRSSR